MSKETIAKLLKQYRKLNHYSVNEVSDYLYQHHHTAAPKTIYGWESGTTQPNADTFMCLCELYKINDVLSIYSGYEQDELPLIPTTEEENFIIALREHPEMKHAIQKLLDL